MNNARRRKVFFLWWAAAALGCFVFAATAQAVSMEEEERLGREVLAEINKHFKLLNDPLSTHFLAELGQRFVAHLAPAPFRFRFYIIRSATPNAFAAPGGQIFVFSGLIELLERPDELAAVIAHEIGHVAARHLSERMEQSKKIGLATLAAVLAGALVGGELGSAVAVGSAAAGLQAQLHYSRADERQADQLGFTYMLKEGFDPGGMISTLKKLEAGRWLGSDKLPAYLQTHPAGPERMANLDSMLANLPPAAHRGTRDENLDRLYPFFRATVKALCAEPRSAEAFFLQQSREQPQSPLPDFALGVLYGARGDYPLALSHLQQARKFPQVPAAWLDFFLAQAHQRNGQSAEAAALLEQALDRDRRLLDNAGFCLLLGTVYVSLERNREAVQVLERLLSLPADHQDAHYQLGLAYGRQGRRGLGHYHFGMYFLLQGKTQKAAFHFDAAAARIREEPGLEDKIRRARRRLEAPAP